MKEKTISLINYQDRFFDEIRELQKIFWEKDSHEQLLAFLINNNMKSSTDYTDLWTDYLLLVQNWRKITKDFEYNVVNFFTTTGMTLSQWYYDFETQELTLYEV